MILELGAIGLLLLLSGLFSGAESAVVAANRLKLAAEVEEGRRGAALALRLLAQPERLLSFLLLGNNLVNVALAAVFSAMVGRWAAGWGPLATTVLLTPILLVLGENVPKTLALRGADRITPAIAPILWAGVRLLHPVIWLLSSLARLLGGRASEDDSSIRSRDELRILLEVEAGEDSISDQERRIASRVFDFGEKTAQSAMLPLVDVTALPLDATPAQASALVRRTGYSRIPVFDQRIDNLVGIVHAKDLLARGSGHQELRPLLHMVPYVPETQPLPALLSTLQGARRGMAFVVDEYGAVTGLATVEDILEEIVGEIEDEYDRRKAHRPEPEPDGSFLVSGRVELEVLTEVLGRPLPRGPYETAAGLVIHQAGGIPEPGESLEIQGITFEVTEADGRRIRQLRIRTEGSPAREAPEPRTGSDPAAPPPRTH